jgi:hypothetical protein
MYIHIVDVAFPSLHCSTIIIHFPSQVHGFRYISRLPSEQPQIHHLPTRPTIIYQLFVVIAISKKSPHILMGFFKALFNEEGINQQEIAADVTRHRGSTAAPRSSELCL